MQRPSAVRGMSGVPQMSRRTIYLLLYLLAIAGGALWYLRGSVLAAANGSGEPVLVELFTSEGCSSCPPADALLASLQAKSAGGSAHTLVVLSEHVDYWDHDGWRDPYSSAAATQRQSAYGARFKLDSIYTPQMVVDGKFEFVGSDRISAGRAINEAGTAEKVHLKIVDTVWQQDKLVARVQVAQVPEALRGATLYAAVADVLDVSQVEAGENTGRTLKHVSVVRVLQPVGPVGSVADPNGSTFQIEAPGHGQHGQQQLVIFAQQPNLGPVVGAAVRAL